MRQLVQEHRWLAIRPRQVVLGVADHYCRLPVRGVAVIGEPDSAWVIDGTWPCCILLYVNVGIIAQVSVDSRLKKPLDVLYVLKQMAFRAVA